MNFKISFNASLIWLALIAQPLLLFNLACSSRASGSNESATAEAKAAEQSEKGAAKLAQIKAKEEAEQAKIKAKEAAELAKIKAKEAAELAKEEAREKSGHHHSPAPAPAPPTPPAPTPAPPAPPTPPTPTPPSPPTSSNGAGGNVIFGVQELPANNMLNTNITSCPVSPNNAAWLGAMNNPSGPIYCCFDSQPYQGVIVGIPYNVPSTSQMVPVTFSLYGDESDPGPYLLPLSPPVVEGSAGTAGVGDANGEEGGPVGSGDGHLITLDTANGISYELFQASIGSNGDITAGSGAIFHLNSNAERTPGYTSACAFGYTLLVPLAKYAEAATGAINHAIGINIDKTTTDYVWPANHQAGLANQKLWPPMGQYLRLKASSAATLIPKAPPQAKIILQALATYGAIIQENGSDWYLNGDPNVNWNHSDLEWIKENTVGNRDMEFIDVSALEIAPNTAQANSPSSANGASSTAGGDTGNSSDVGGLSINKTHHSRSTPRKN